MSPSDPLTDSLPQQPAIGIYGGTFDPIHLGHLRTVLDVAEQCRLEQVRFIPSHTPPHRERPYCSEAQRVSLIKAAIHEETSFVLDRCELTRRGKSYTIDTLSDLRQRFPSTPLCLIIGLDAFLTLPQWHQWEKLLHYAHIIITMRPNQPVASLSWPCELQKRYNQAKITDYRILHHDLCGKIYFCQVTQLDISSTDIRKRIHQGRSIRYLVCDEVYRLITEQGLYHAAS